MVYTSYLECIRMAEDCNIGWLSGVKILLHYVNKENIWLRMLSHTNIENPNQLCKQITSVFNEKYSVPWKDVIDNGISSTNQNGGNKLRTYCTYKQSYCRENYLCMIKCKETRSRFTRLRVSAHNLMIETGRHLKPKLNVEDRVCTACHIIEDESHFVTSCSIYTTLRQTMYRRLPTYVLNSKLYQQ